MLPAILKHIVATLRRFGSGEADFLDGLRLPGGLFAQTRCARRIDATARRIAAMGVKIGRLSGRLHARAIPGLVDADRSLRRMLGELREDWAACAATWRCGMCASAMDAPARAWKRRSRS
ncbi:hypothetical protein [Massilia sp. Se16.2.3]|uniref:hypothetical protein n=1 Tax=Massilia sp. Se16.2.3 TaxID=2709303 RepID=UPI00160250EE|nr:hypothetical protein [Massilia sp. Se16.2.3]QNA99366.1 hypothetical protein G4G31_11825 [Massilia sp. Se16.2.3]